MKKSIPFLFTSIMMLTFTGCLGYRLQASKPVGVKKIYMESVINSTVEPSLEIELSKALRGRIQFDERTQLVNHEADADTILEADIHAYTISPIAYNRTELTTAERYRIRIDASATLKSAKTGEQISTAKNHGEAIFIFNTDMTSSKRNAMPKAAQDLAKYLVDDLLETWE